jgi:non-specific serine/threonine protein kinase
MVERRRVLFGQYQRLLGHLTWLREEARLVAQAAAAIRQILAPHTPNGNGTSGGIVAPSGMPRGNLPAPVSHLVGRERELGMLQDALRRTRLLVLVGACGCGKTRLARELAHTCAGRFPDGVWWVDLHDVQDPALLHRVVASALRIPPRLARGVTAIAAHLRDAHALLILDNCEHQVTACASLAEATLHSCPHLQILVTSRERLGLAGETRWPVGPLSVPRRDGLSVDEAMAFEGIQLFVLCAKATGSSFVLTGENVDAVATICSQLDGLPLAIELAASRLISLSTHEIMDRLPDRFSLLSGVRRGVPRYHRNLRAAVERSYDLLLPEERVLFGRVSSFAGGFSLSEAEASCTGGEVRAEDVLDLVSRLVDKSMVDVEPTLDGAIRYRMTETLRLYGRARLAETS